MRVYKTRPQRGMARKAWDYFCNNRGKPPNEMFYSRDHIDGQRWVADYGFNASLGGTTPYGCIGGSDIAEVKTTLIQYWIEKEREK